MGLATQTSQATTTDQARLGNHVSRHSSSEEELSLLTKGQALLTTIIARKHELTRVIFGRGANVGWGEGPRRTAKGNFGRGVKTYIVVRPRSSFTPRPNLNIEKSQKGEFGRGVKIHLAVITGSGTRGKFGRGVKIDIVVRTSSTFTSRPNLDITKY